MRPDHASLLHRPAHYLDMAARCGTFDRETFHPLFAILDSPEGTATLSTYIKSVFDWCHSVHAKLSHDPGFGNASLRCEYRDLTTKLRKLYGLVNDYIDIIVCCPIYNEEAISAELRDRDENARFDVENIDRFTHTIDYLNQLDTWLRQEKTKLDEINWQFDILKRETREAMLRAETVEREAAGGKKISLGATAGSLAAVGGGALLLAGGIVLGGVLLPIGGAVAALGYSSSTFFKEREQESKMISNEIDKINKAADDLHGIMEVAERRKYIERFQLESDIIHRPLPLLSNLKQSLTKLSELIERNKTFKEEWNQARKTLYSNFMP